MIDLARQSLSIELHTLQALHDHLDTQLVSAVEHILTCQGRVIITGVGKSSLIAQKIVATFNSTGTPAIFMHAADAIHGDLGVMQPEDILLCLSKSGETEELRKLLPIIKEKGHLIIAIVGNRESFLAALADAVIYTPIHREADPHDLAPTASAIAQLAVGDVLAACLMTLRGFEPSDFASLHPGGSLGKKLLMTVSHFSQQNARPMVSSQANVREVIIEISGARLGATAVADKDGNLAGIITDGDLRRMLLNQADLDHITAKEIATPTPVTIQSSAKAYDALMLMRSYNITQLLVLKDQQYCGIIHIHDILREGIS